MGKYISKKVASIPPYAIKRFFDIAATMDDIISLGIGEPDFKTPEPILQAGIRALQAGETHYSVNPGILPLREAIAANLQKRYGVSYNPEREVIITVGVSESLRLVFDAILDPGDEVIVPEPSYIGYVPPILLADGKAVVVPTRAENNFQPTPAEIEAAITSRTKALLMGYPNNPTGTVLQRETMIAMVQIAQKHDLLIISDEIYDRLVYDWQHISFASLPGARERTILLGGFSKDYAMTGWRLGYAAAPANLAEALLKIHQYTIMCAPTVSQYAALSALTDPAAEEALQAMVAEYDVRRRLLLSGLNDIGLACIEPRGAFYAFPSVAITGMDAMAFAEKLLLEEQVAVIPGTVFGTSGEGYVRCTYATATDQIAEALERMARFARRHG